MPGSYGDCHDLPPALGIGRGRHGYKGLGRTDHEQAGLALGEVADELQVLSHLVVVQRRQLEVAGALVRVGVRFLQVLDGLSSSALVPGPSTVCEQSRTSTHVAVRTAVSSSGYAEATSLNRPGLESKSWCREWGSNPQALAGGGF